MYSAVSARTRGIATLRALGFGRGSVVVSVMLESLARWRLIGGLIGGGAHFICSLTAIAPSTMNFQSFSQVVSFAFDGDAGIADRQGITWAAVIGVIGGLFPALRAARLPIASALREL